MVVPGGVRLMGGRRRACGVATLAPGQSRMRRNVMMVAGVVGVLGGLGLLGYGLAPTKDLWDAVGPTFSGGPPPEDLSERLDASMAALKARALVDGLGFMALMTGVVLVKMALAGPKPPPVEKLVEAEVARRLAQQGHAPMGAATLPLTAHPMALAQPSTPPPTPVVPSTRAPTSPSAPAAPRPVTASPPRRTHCNACGTVLVAGGRICPQGHAQA